MVPITSRRPNRSSRDAARVFCEPLDRRLLLLSGGQDGTFAGDGHFQFNFPGAPFHANDVALQSDGKAIVAGSKSGNLALARLNTNGALDTSFGNGGLFEWARREQATDVLVQPDGKILVAFGAATQGFTNMAVGRILANGTGHDSAFGSDGIAHTSQWGDDVVHDIALQQDGKVIAVGSRRANDDDYAIVRYTTGGAPDTTFDNDGIVIAGFGDDEQARAVALDYTGNPSSNPRWGQIVVVGDKRSGTSNPSTRVTICRLNTNGSFDNTFDSDGKLTSPDLSINPEEYATDVMIQPGGKIVIAGCARSGVPVLNDFLLARYLPGGALDNLFGTSGDGIVQSDFGSEELAHEMAPSFWGGFLVSGRRGAFGMVAAYTSEGRLDGRFNSNGWTTTPLVGAASVATTLRDVAPIRRVMLASGGAVSRYWDVGSVVSISSFDPVGHETGREPASILVQRTSNLGHAERVYLHVSGTARPPYLLNADYTTADVNVVNPLVGASWIEIDPVFDVRGGDVLPIDDAAPEDDETVIFTIAENDAYDIGTPSSVTMVIRDNDNTAPPAVAEAAFLYETAPQRVTFRFSQDVTASIGADDFAVSGPTGNVPFSFAYDASLNTATLSFSSTLPDGDYTARAIAAGITNSNGQPMPADHLLDFFFMLGDANLDRRVNLQDFNVLAANFGLSNRTYSQGDFTYDGLVNLQDFNILASRFGQSVAPAASRTGTVGERDENDALRDLLD